MTFRRRLTLWSTLVAAVSILICSLVAAWYVYRLEQIDADRIATEESAHFFEQLAEHGGPRFDWTRIEVEAREWLPVRNPPHFLEVRRGREVLWRSGNLPAPGFVDYPAGRHEMTFGARTLKLFINEKDGITLALGSDTASARREALGVLAATLAGLPVALIFAWLGGRKLASLAVEPVRQMTSAAEKITAQHLDRRVPVPAVEDEIKRHALVLNAAFARLERSYHQAARFSADASHELKTPLTALRAGIEALLHSPELSDGDHAAMSSLLEQTQRLSGIIASLLLLARADAGKLVLDIGSHDLTPLIEACVEDARIMASPRQIQVAASLPATAPAAIDPSRFAQILSNLLDNAVKYNHDNGGIKVTLTAKDALWHLSVAGTGSGIPADSAGRLFDRFFRAAHTAEIPGQGLGLSLSRELARAHGGDVRFVASADGWTEFVVEVPAVPAPAGGPVP